MDDSAWFMAEEVIGNVMYPSGFSAICRVHCTEAEMCAVDSPLDKLDIGMRVVPTWQL